MDTPKNAVLHDYELQSALKAIHPDFGDFCTRVAGEAWGKPALSQHTKALITIAIDVVNQAVEGPGAPFEAHLRMALKQGATYQEIEELLLLTCVYAGFNKAALAFGRWGEIKERHQAGN
jgi:4-carboxymuconolactone decarboxylase